MMTLAIDHIQLAIPKCGEGKARAFWGGLIGLVEIEKPAALKVRGGCWFDLAGAELHLGVETPFSPAQKAHPGFAVTDIKNLATRIKGAGHPVKWDNAIKERQRFFSTDPFGNRIEFLEN